MGSFTRKGRLQIQQELLEMARRALDILKVTTHRQQYDHGSCIELASWDSKSLPLEYRKWVGANLETLVYWVYDDETDSYSAKANAGTFDAVNELREALTFIQTALVDRDSISNDTVKRKQALRAQNHHRSAS